MLEKTIYDLKEKTYKIDTSLEIDQTGSHAVFTSLTLGNKAMASQANLFGGDKQDINKYILSKFEEFVQSEIEKESNPESEELVVEDPIIEEIFSQKEESIKWEEITPRLLKLFSTERDLAKKTFMTYNYSQGSSERSKKLVEIVSEHIQDLTFIERRIIFKIGYNYTNYLDFCFENFKSQLSAFKKCYNTFSKMSHRTAIRSLDGTLFQWEFFYLRTHTGSRYNPVANRNQNYKKIKPFTVPSEKEYIKQLEGVIKQLSEELKTLEMESKPVEKKRRDLKKCNKALDDFRKSSRKLREHKSRVFRPGFVHCLDGSIIRLLIYHMYKKHNYHINHVHDSIQCHPNEIDNVYCEIDLIYRKFNNMGLLDLYTKPSKELLSDTEKKSFQNSINDFLELREQFNINVTPENMYPYE